MKIEKFYLLFFLIFLSCRTPSQREIAQYSNRPKIKDPCLSNGDGTCYRNGELVEDTLNYIMGDYDDYNKITCHLMELEKFYFNCKKFNECTQTINCQDSLNLE